MVSSLVLMLRKLLCGLKILLIVLLLVLIKINLKTFQNKSKYKSILIKAKYQNSILLYLYIKLRRNFWFHQLLLQINEFKLK